MKRIIITSDLSDEAACAFAPAIRLAGKLGAEVELLYVVPDVQALPHGAPLAPKQSEPTLDAQQREALERLSRIAEDLGPGVEATVLVAANVAQAIAGHARSREDCWIAMSTHGRTGWRHLLLGSVAEQVLRHATTPVITFPCNVKPH